MSTKKKWLNPPKLENLPLIKEIIKLQFWGSENTLQIASWLSKCQNGWMRGNQVATPRSSSSVNLWTETPSIVVYHQTFFFSLIQIVVYVMMFLEIAKPGTIEQLISIWVDLALWLVNPVTTVFF